MSKLTEDWFSPGTRQTERASPVLDPAECKLDGRTLEDHFNLTQRLSENIPFPEESTTLSKDKRWVELFEILNDDGELNENLAALANQQSFPPHLALFVTFLTLYEDSQQQLNDLVPAHLDYYYRRVLGLKNKPLESDRVHTIIKLAKNISEYQVAAASLLDGGEDADSNPILYRTERDLIVNHAQIATVKSLHVQFFPPNRAEIRINDAGESIDDTGIQFDDNSPAWPPFGLNPDDERLQALAARAAPLGFAISSPSMALKEGVRELTITMEFDPSTFQFDSAMDKPGTFEIYLTGEKGWTDPIRASVNQQGDHAVNFRISLSTSDPAVLPFRRDIHGAEINTDSVDPVLRCLLNTGDNPVHNYEAMRQWQLRNITLRVGVKGVQELVASNDFGPVNTSKAFHPFGPLPNNGGTFSFGSEELAMKPLESVKLHLDWLNTPEDLAHYYLSYGANLPSLDVKSFEALGEIWIGSQRELTPGERITPWKQFTPVPKRLFFEPSIKTINGIHREIRGKEPHSIELTKNSGLLFEPVMGSEREVVSRKPEILRLVLDGPNLPGKLSAFGHKEFPRLMVSARDENSSDDTNINEPLEPYTPIARLTGVDYVTVDEWSLAGGGRTLQFLHIEPFGTRELSGVDEHGANFIPSIENEGYLYVGIRNLGVPGSVSILFQVDEASADPDSQPSAGIQWHYLSDGEWLHFQETAIKDDTQALLRSGIIVFSMPEEASLTHQRMPSGLHWIRAASSTMLVA